MAIETRARRVAAGRADWCGMAMGESPGGGTVLYSTGMRKPEDILQDAMRLSDEERGALALELLDSLSRPDSHDEAAWIAAIETRARRALTADAEADVTVDDAIARIESALEL